MIQPRILLLTTNLGAGGAQKVFRDQVNYFSAKFYVVVCVFNSDGTINEDKKLKFVSLDVPGGKNFFSKFYFFLLRINRLRKIKKDHDITHSISHLEGADYVNLFSARGEKTICWLHGTKKHDGAIKGMLGFVRHKILMPYAYRRFDSIAAVSDGIRKEVLHSFGLDSEKVVTIVNGFDLNTIREKSSASAPSFPIVEGDKILITHCRLSPQKNLSALLEIFANVKKEYPCKLVILGDGELGETLYTQSQAEGLRTFCQWKGHEIGPSYDVYFLGYSSNPYPFLSMASLYLMTSSWEGFPLSLGEAMACGIPVIASDCFTGPREMLGVTDILQPTDKPIDAGTGILMPLADSVPHVSTWSKTVIGLLKDEVKRKSLAAAGRARISAFDENAIRHKWLTLING